MSVVPHASPNPSRTGRPTWVGSAVTMAPLSTMGPCTHGVGLPPAGELPPPEVLCSTFAMVETLLLRRSARKCTKNPARGKRAEEKRRPWPDVFISNSLLLHEADRSHQAGDSRAREYCWAKDPA